jgi:hypothetical protein
MLTIYLLFQLVAGQLTEVDAFMDLAQCQASQAQLTAMVEHARSARPELPAVTSFCKPVKVSLSDV